MIPFPCAKQMIVGSDLAFVVILSLGAEYPAFHILLIILSVSANVRFKRVDLWKESTPTPFGVFKIYTKRGIV